MGSAYKREEEYYGVEIAKVFGFEGQFDDGRKYWKGFVGKDFLSVLEKNMNKGDDFLTEKLVNFYPALYPLEEKLVRASLPRLREIIEEFVTESLTKWAPKVGEEVSYAFNGDCYLGGTVTKVTPTGRVTTSQGKKYRRIKGCLSAWTDGTWSLVKGSHESRNPEF